MKTHRPIGAMIPGTDRTMQALEAPARPAYAFLGATGWVGGQCACGFTVSARTIVAMQAALLEHRAPATCDHVAEVARAEDENLVDDEA